MRILHTFAHINEMLEFLGKNLHLVGCATVCGKSKVMLLTRGAFIINDLLRNLNFSSLTKSVRLGKSEEKKKML